MSIVITDGSHPRSMLVTPHRNISGSITVGYVGRAY